MARRGRRSRSAPSLLLVAAVVVAVGAGAWWLYRHPRATPPASAPPKPIVANPAHVDPRNDGREVELDGPLRVARPARDDAFAIEAAAVVLLRDVRMLQWQEHCAGAQCRYALEWSSQRIDSRAFREPAGHRNDTPFPFSSERFPAADVRLGAFEIDANLAAAGAAPQAYPVSIARLPPNLAATFRDCDGALCTGDPARPVAGDLRVAYRIVPDGVRRIVGVQQDGRVRAPER
ncbi:TMEM43 family protein [Dokdonella sp.]|uniref:TMEM43 family protein n=1 Tax=Dokdonella sp. TaxID=2291710 RepID=UPI002F41551F